MHAANKILEPASALALVLGRHRHRVLPVRSSHRGQTLCFRPTTRKPASKRKSNASNTSVQKQPKLTQANHAPVVNIMEILAQVTRCLSTLPQNCVSQMLMLLARLVTNSDSKLSWDLLNNVEQAMLLSAAGGQQDKVLWFDKIVGLFVPLSLEQRGSLLKACNNVLSSQATPASTGQQAHAMQPSSSSPHQLTGMQTNVAAFASSSQQPQPVPFSAGHVFPPSSVSFVGQNVNPVPSNAENFGPIAPQQQWGPPISASGPAEANSAAQVGTLNLADSLATLPPLPPLNDYPDVGVPPAT